jgi:Endosomal/lysosomal potassium channel TMEM175
VVITLLVIEIGRPEVGKGDLGAALLHQWPEYLAFAVSFHPDGAGAWPRSGLLPDLLEKRSRKSGSSGVPTTSM